MEASGSQRGSRGSKGGGRQGGSKGGRGRGRGGGRGAGTERQQQGGGNKTPRSRSHAAEPSSSSSYRSNSQLDIPLDSASLCDDAAQSETLTTTKQVSVARKAFSSGAAPAKQPALSSWSAFCSLWSPEADEAAATASLPADEASANLEGQRDELTAIAAIYSRELRIVTRDSGDGSGHPFVPSEVDAVIDLEASPASDGPPEIPPGAVIEVSVALNVSSKPVAQVNVPPELRKMLPSLLTESASNEGLGDANKGGTGPEADGSGDDGSSLLPLATLPPLVFRLRLPATYPSRAAPVFGVRCAWLSDASLEVLCGHLEGLCAEAAGGPVVCELIEWLRSDALGALPSGTLSPLHLPCEQQPPALVSITRGGPHPTATPHQALVSLTRGGASSSAANTPPAASTPPDLCSEQEMAAGSGAKVARMGEDPEAARAACAGRAARWPRRAAEVLSTLVAHAQAAADAEWRDSLHGCGVCLETHASIDCIRFVRCKHTFCKSCCTSYFESQMADGAASALTCPEPSCRVCATPPEVKMLLPAELFDRYERLSLQTTLETMSDICWCPRCEYPAFLLGEGEGEGGRLALCSTCHLSFCIECKQSWHGLAPCANLATRWRNANEAEREVLKQKYGEKVVEEVQSGEWLLSNTKPCPNCNTSIQKNGGCNHISCRKCNYEWCWLCTKRYHVGHFKNGCEQFSDDFFDEINLSREEFEQQYVVLNHW